MRVVFGQLLADDQQKLCHAQRSAFIIDSFGHKPFLHDLKQKHLDKRTSNRIMILHAFDIIITSYKPR